MKRTTYKGKALENISFPLGGIGTGCIGLAGNGSLVDWEIYNGPNKGSDNGFSHFAVKTEKDGKVVDARVLNGDRTKDLLGQLGKGFGHGMSNVTMAGFPHFRDCTFTGEFPIAELTLSDEDFPGCAKVTAFNPLIPLDSDSSSLPVAMFSIELENTTDSPLCYTLSAVLRNPRWKSVNKAIRKENMTGIFLDSADNREDSTDYCEMTLATPDTEDVFPEEYWFRGMWYDHIETYWRELTTAGFPAERKYDTPGTNDHSTLFVKKSAEPGEKVIFRFVLSWNKPLFENWWLPPKNPDGTENRVKLKNYYSTRFPTSKDSAEYAITNWERLWNGTKKFHDALFSSTLPEEVIDAVSSTVSVLKTPTCLRIGEKGDFWGWEGLGEHAGSCEGTCTHVWNYVYSTCFLFPDIERNIRENDYKYNQQPSGEMSFRTKLPFGSEPGTNRGCLDGTMGGVMKTYREWKLSGDDEWLRSIWGSVKRSLEYAWSEENKDAWDRDRDGVAEGRQHHTLDMELFGPSSWLEGFYLGALKAGSEMARYLGDPDADLYEELFENGKKWTRENLFNGKYFIQKLDLNDRKLLEKYCNGTVDIFGNDATESYWNSETGEIKYQIGEGCEIDQMLAQWHADILGLGDLFDPGQVDIALHSMYKNNFKPDMRKVANPFRIFALNGDAGAIMCDFPEGARRPTIPILTSCETMHGFEYSFAGLLMSRGLIDEGLSVVRGVRDRYNGEKRNPWNEIECGSNYARSMSSFSFLPILSGMSFDAVKYHLGFEPKLNTDDFRVFFSNGTAWGIYEATNNTAKITVLGGELKLKTLKASAAGKVYADGKEVSTSSVDGTVVFDTAVSVKESLIVKE